MNILEEEIEEVIWKALTQNPDLLVETGFPYHSDMTYVRQFDLGNYGRTDIVGFSVDPYNGSSRRHVYVHIIELKKGAISAATFFQAIRYAKGISELFINEQLKYNLTIEMHLIGKWIDDSEFIYIPDIFLNVSMWTFSIDLKTGIQFNRHSNYSLAEPGFKLNESRLLPILKSNVRTTYKYRVPDDLPF